MVVQFPASVTLAGRVLPASWDGSSVAALGDLQIDWGRNDVYEPTSPASLTLSIIDPTGDYATDNGLVGSTIVIGRTSPSRTMFRGRVTDIESVAMTVADPETGSNVDVYIVKLTATDKSAELAQTRISQAQPVVYGSGAPIAGGWWRPSDAATRVGQLNTYGAILSIVSSVVTPNIPVILGLGGAAAADTAYLHHRWGRDNMSLLELLEELYVSVPLGHVNYDANSDGIIVGTPATTGGFSLNLVAGLIVMVAIAGYTIDAGQVITPQGKNASIKSTVAAAIDSVQARFARSPNGSDPWDEAYIEQLTDRGLTSATHRVLTINSWFRDSLSGGLGSYGDDYATALAAKVVALVDDLNGQFTPPPLRFDFRRFSTGVSAVDDILLDTMDHPTPLYLPGWPMSHLPNVGPQFQLIGGTIRWVGRRAGSQLEEGWVVDMRLAPAVSAVDPVTLATLVTNVTPAMNAFDPIISIADFASVSTGLA